MTERLKHLVDSRDLNRDWLEKCFVRTRLMEDAVRDGQPIEAGKRMVYGLFYEPSIITLGSFQKACGHLGWSFPEVARESMWASTLQREIEVLNALGYDLIILRSDQAGGAKSAAEYSKVPIINAGESFTHNQLPYPTQHPTQAMADLYTVYRHRGHIDGLRWVFVGDLRTNAAVNSLLFTLSNFEVDIVLASKAGSYNIPQAVEAYLADYNRTVVKTDDLYDHLQAVDVIYLAPPSNQQRPDTYQDSIGKKELDLLPENAILMHDMLRGRTPPKIDDPRFIERLQIEYGVYTRMAGMTMLLST